MRLEPGWLIILPLEGLGQSMPTKDTTDIAWIIYEKERNHKTTVHLSIPQWQIVYYDSYLHFGRVSDKDKSCDVALKDVRERYSVRELQLPVEDPHRYADCSIAQHDSWSCGPLAWREIEILLRGPLDDGERPLAIRSHHIDLVYSKLLMERDSINHGLSVHLDESPNLQLDHEPVLASQMQTNIAGQGTTSQISTSPESSMISMSIPKLVPGTIAPVKILF